MMLLSVAPMVLLFARVSRERHRQGRPSFVPTWVFLGLIAYSVFRLVTAADSGFLAWDDAGPYGHELAGVEATSHVPTPDGEPEPCHAAQTVYRSDDNKSPIYRDF